MRRSYFILALILVISTVTLFFLLAFASSQSDTEKEIVRYEHEGAVTDLAYSPEGDYIASSSLDGNVRLWDTATGQSVRVLNTHTDEVYAVEFSCDGQWIASSGYDRQIIINEVSGKTIKRLFGFQGWSVAIALSPDSRHLAAWSMDGRIWIWDLEREESIRTLEGKRWGMTLAWSPDGRYLASGRYDITLWDVKSGKQARSLKGHHGTVRSLSFSPDGCLLASASIDKTARVWNVDSGELLLTLKPEGFIHYTSSGPVTNPISVPVIAVAFSLDGKWLATGGADRTVRLWDVASGKNIRTFQGHRMSVTAVEFSPDGQWVASSSLDRTIRLWPID